jgi:hypothetical protein
MSERVRRTTITFSQPFFVESLNREQSAGTYEVETVEEPLEGLSFPAYRTLSTSILIPAKGRAASSCQVVPIAPAIVREALRQAENTEPDDPTGDH